MPMRLATAIALLAACQPDPKDQVRETVDYRDGSDGGATSGERGTVKITEILWSGSVRWVSDDPDDPDARDRRVWDPDDVFVELRNEGNRAVNLSGWQITLDGARKVTWEIPASDLMLGVGDQAYIAAKTDGCFPEPDWVIPELALPQGDPLELTLRDADERLIEPVGSETQRPFAGGYDLVSSYSMERINLMFGGVGGEPQSWHFYNRTPCSETITKGEGNSGLSCFEDIANNDRMLPACRAHTLASPGRPNSPDYSGAYASGGFE